MAVEDLTFRVERGAICSLLGPNGAGKSTTVKMLTGQLEPTMGEAFVLGVNVRERPVEVRRRTGVLPEGLGLFDSLTVEEHLRMTGEVYGLSRGAARERIAALLRTLALEQGMRTWARHCSQGMRKKTALAMALLPNPDVLFLDEPFEALDPPSVRAVERLLRQYASRAGTVLLTSHVLAAVQRVATQFVALRQGRCVWTSAQGESPPPIEDLFEAANGQQPEEVLKWLGPSPSSAG